MTRKPHIVKRNQKVNSQHPQYIPILKLIEEHFGTKPFGYEDLMRKAGSVRNIKRYLGELKKFKYVDIVTPPVVVTKQSKPPVHNSVETMFAQKTEQNNSDCKRLKLENAQLKLELLEISHKNQQVKYEEEKRQYLDIISKECEPPTKKVKII